MSSRIVVLFLLISSLCQAIAQSVDDTVACDVWPTNTSLLSVSSGPSGFMVDRGQDSFPRLVQLAPLMPALNELNASQISVSIYCYFYYRFYFPPPAIPAITETDDTGCCEQGFNFTGHPIKIDGSNLNTANNMGNVAFVSCDGNAYPENVNASQTVTKLLTSPSPPIAIILYSTQSISCSYDPYSPTALQYSNVFFLFASRDPELAARIVLQQNQNSFVTLASNMALTNANRRDGSDNDSDKGPSTGM